MFDVEFLLSPPDRLSRPMLYLYRDGVYRSRLVNWARTTAQRNGKECYGRPPEEIVSAMRGDSLFGDGYTIVKWNGLEPQTKDVQWCVERFFAELPSSRQAILVMAPFDPEAAGPDPVQRMRLFVQSGAGHLLLEPDVNKATLPAILRLFEAETRLVDQKTLCRQASFNRHFSEFIETSRTRISLHALQSEFDRAVILYTDPDTGQFEVVDEEGESVDAGRASRVRPLRKLIFKRDVDALSESLAGLSRNTAIEPRDQLIDATIVLLTSSHNRKQDRSVQREAALVRLSLWCAILLATHQCAVSQDLSGIDGLYRDFLVRSDPNRAEPPLAGLWPELEIMMQRSDIAVPREKKLIASFRALLAIVPQDACIWIQELGNVIGKDREVDLPEVTDGWGDRYDAAIDAFGLAGIVGHTRAVTILRERLTNRRHADPLLFVGLPGIGKMTIARAYVAAILCDTPDRPDPAEPCGTCPVCRDFRRGSGLDYLEFNPEIQDGEEKLSERLARLDRTALSNRRIIVLDRADECPGMVQACLLTLEKRFSNLTMIFLANDINKLSAAAVSRFRVVSLHELSRSEQSAIAKRALDKLFPEMTADMVRLIVASSRGSPGVLRRQVAKTLAARPTTIDETANAIGLRGASEAIDFWRKILSEACLDEQAVWSSSEGQADSLLDMIKAVLIEIRNVHELGEVSDPVLAILAPTTLPKLAHSMADRATGLGKTFDDLWHTVASCLTEDNPESGLSLRRQTNRFRRVLTDDSSLLL